jgi:hypothetical protein
MKRLILLLIIALFLGAQHAAAQTGGSTSSTPEAPRGEQSLTVSSQPVTSQFENQQFDFAPENEMRSRMPVVNSLPQGMSSATEQVFDEQGFAVGSDGAGPAPSSFGAVGAPFTTSRILGGTGNPAQSYPYRRSGKLYMAFDGTTYNSVCSASMIGRSLLLTAAHCVHEYGEGASGWARKVMFVPAMHNTHAPFQTFESTQYMIPTVYFNGTDTCTTRGVVCNNDIAVVHLNNNARGQQAGNITGWFGYSWNNYGFSVPAAPLQHVLGNKPCAAITQLGYPLSHDQGKIMQTNTANGCYAPNGNLRNTWLPSAMTGGSSGGPWVLNFGFNAAGASYGNHAARNVITGVTSWGYNDINMKMQGASFFGQNKEFPAAGYGARGAGNIGRLVYDACDNPAFAAWKLQSKGRCR